MIRCREMLVVFLLFCVSSCRSPEQDHWAASRSPTLPVSGIIILDGKPVENAIILFHSEGHEISAHGLSDASGFFRLTTYEENDGAVSGNHLISVKKIEEQITPHPLGDPYSPNVIESWLIPQRYADPKTSELSWTISAESTEPIIMNLKSR